jgi:hypothetical protein
MALGLDIKILILNEIPGRYLALFNPYFYFSGLGWPVRQIIGRFVGILERAAGYVETAEPGAELNGC